jgi:cold shock CspA family protein
MIVFILAMIRLNVDKAFGFIQPNAGGADILFINRHYLIENVLHRLTTSLPSQ